MTKPVINLSEVEFQTEKHLISAGSDVFEAKFAPIGAHIGAQRLGYRLTVLPPGKKAWPFHAHYVTEEMFFVIEGKGQLRFGAEQYPIGVGDCIAAPAGGPEVAHQIVNDSDADLKYLCVSTVDETDITDYPDSNKYGVLVRSVPGSDRSQPVFIHMTTKNEMLDYWEGEDR